MLQLRDRLFARTAHEMAPPKRSKSQFFRNKGLLQRDFQINQSVAGLFSHRAEDGKMGAQRAAREGKSMNSAARIGSSSPLGATIIEGGANFSLFPRGARASSCFF